MPQEIFLFLWMKNVLKGKGFADVEEKQILAEALKGIKINEFKNCFEQLKKTSRWVYSLHGEYFEGD